MFFTDVTTESVGDWIAISFSTDYGSASKPALNTLFWPTYLLEGWYAYWNDWYTPQYYDGAKFDFSRNPATGKKTLRAIPWGNATPNLHIAQIFSISIGLKQYYCFSNNILLYRLTQILFDSSLLGLFSQKGGARTI